MVVVIIVNHDIYDASSMIVSMTSTMTKIVKMKKNKMISGISFGILFALRQC